MAKTSLYHRIRNRYRAFIRKRIDYRETYEHLSDDLALDIDYLILIAISAAIATLGLIMNNAAVIIGAMIISPLMEPIVSSGFAFAIDDGELGKRAAKTIGIGVIMAVAIAALITLLSPARENTAEIIARTSPNVLDLGIALLCGLAGAYAFTIQKSAESVVGIAISVALMPPLCVTGFGLATGQIQVLAGGFFLFTTNFSAIFIVSTLLFLILGFYRNFNPREKTRALKERRKAAVTVILLTGLAIPLVYTLNSSLAQKSLEKNINRILSEHLEVPGVSRISFWAITAGDEIQVQVNTIDSISYSEAADLESELNAATGRKYTLRLVQVPAVYIDEGSGQTLYDYLTDFSRRSVGQISDSASSFESGPATLASSESAFPLPAETIPRLYPRLGVSSVESVFAEDATHTDRLIIHSLPASPLSIQELTEFETAILDNFAATTDLKVRIECTSVEPVVLYFDSGQTDLPGGAGEELTAVAAFMQKQPAYHATILAYADSTGSNELNLSLSQERADNIKAFLVGTGLVASESVTAVGMGESAADLETELETGRLQQRRAEIHLQIDSRAQPEM